MKKTYLPLQLNILIQLKQYDEAKSIASQYRTHKTYAMDAFMTLLEVYIHEEDSHRLAILDADFNEELELQPLEFKQKSYELFMNYYEKNQK